MMSMVASMESERPDLAGDVATALPYHTERALLLNTHDELWPHATDLDGQPRVPLSQRLMVLCLRLLVLAPLQPHAFT